MKFVLMLSALLLSLSSFAREEEPGNYDTCTLAQQAYQKQSQKSQEYSRRLRELAGDFNCEESPISYSEGEEGYGERDHLLDMIQQSNARLAELSNEMRIKCSRRPEP